MAEHDREGRARPWARSRTGRAPAAAILRTRGVPMVVVPLVCLVAVVSMTGLLPAPPAGAEMGGQRLHITAVVQGAQPPGNAIDVSLSCNKPLLFPPAPMHFFGPGDQDINAQGMDQCTVVAPKPKDAQGMTYRCAASGEARCLSDTTAQGDGQYLVTFTLIATFPTTLPPTTPVSLPGATPAGPDGAPPTTTAAGAGDPNASSPGGGPPTSVGANGATPAPGAPGGGSSDGASGGAGGSDGASGAGASGTTPAGANGTVPGGAPASPGGAAAAPTGAAGSAEAAAAPGSASSSPGLVLVVILLVLACVAGGAAAGVALRRRLQPTGDAAAPGSAGAPASEPASGPASDPASEGASDGTSGSASARDAAPASDGSPAAPSGTP